MDNITFNLNDDSLNQFPMITVTVCNFTPIYIRSIYKRIEYRHSVFSILGITVTRNIKSSVEYLNYNSFHTKYEVKDVVQTLQKSVKLNSIEKRETNILEIYLYAKERGYQYDIYYDSIISIDSPKKCDIQFKVTDHTEDVIVHNLINICNAPSKTKSKFYGFVENNQTLILDITNLHKALTQGYLIIKKHTALGVDVEYLHNVDVITNIDPKTGTIYTETFKQIIPTIDATVILFNETDGCYAVSGVFYWPYYQKLIPVYLWDYSDLEKQRLGTISIIQGQNPLPDDEYEYWDYLESFYKYLHEKHHLIALEARSNPTTHSTLLEYTHHKSIIETTISQEFSNINYVIDRIYSTQPEIIVDQISVIPLAIYDRVPESDLNELTTLLLDIKIQPNDKLRLAEFVKPTTYPIPVTDFNKLNELSDVQLNSYHQGDSFFRLYVINPRSDDTVHKIGLTYTINRYLNIPVKAQPFTTIKIDLDEIVHNTIIENHKLTEIYRTYLHSAISSGKYHRDILTQYTVFDLIEIEYEKQAKTMFITFKKLIDESKYNTLIKNIPNYSVDVEFDCSFLQKYQRQIMQLMFQGFTIYNANVTADRYSGFSGHAEYIHTVTAINPFKCRRLETLTDDEKNSIADISGKHPPFDLRTELSKYIIDLDYKDDWWYDESYTDNAFDKALKYDPEDSTIKYDEYQLVVNYDHDSIPAYDNFPKKDTWNYDLSNHVLINQVKQDVVYDLGIVYDSLNKPLCDQSKYNNPDFCQVNLLNSFPVTNMHLGIVLRDNDPYIQPIKATKCPVPVIVCGIPDIVFDSEFVGFTSFNDEYLVGQYNNSFYWTSDLFRNSQDYISKYTNDPLDDVADLIDELKESDTNHESMFIVHEAVLPSEFYLFIQLAIQLRNTLHPHLSYETDVNSYKTWEEFVDYFNNNYTTASSYDLAKYNFVRVESFLGFDFDIIPYKLEYESETRYFRKVALGTKTSKEYIDNSTNKFVYFGDDSEVSNYIVDKLFNHDSSLNNDVLNDYNNLILNRYTQDSFQIKLHTKVNSTEVNAREFDLQLLYSNDEIPYEIQFQSQIIKAYAAFCPNSTLVPLVNVFKDPDVYQFSDKYTKDTFMNAWDYDVDTHTLVDSDVFVNDDVTDYGEYKLYKIKKLYKYSFNFKTKTYEFKLPESKCYSHLTLKSLSSDNFKSHIHFQVTSGVKYAQITDTKIKVYLYDLIAWDNAFEYIKELDLRTLSNNANTMILKPCKFYYLYAIAVLLQIPYEYIQSFLIIMYRIAHSYKYDKDNNVYEMFNSSIRYLVDCPKSLYYYLKEKFSDHIVESLVRIYAYFKMNCEESLCGDHITLGQKVCENNYLQQTPLLNSDNMIPTQKTLSGKVISLNEINRKYKALNYDYLQNKPLSYYTRTGDIRHELEYMIHWGLNTVLTDYSYHDILFSDWYINIPKSKIKVDSSESPIHIKVPGDFYSQFVVLFTMKYGVIEDNINNPTTASKRAYVVDFQEHKIITPTSKYSLTQVMDPIDIVLRHPHYIYHILELPLPYWIRKYRMKPESRIHEIHARTIPSRAIRQTRFSTAKYNTFRNASKGFAHYTSLLRRGLIFRESDLPVFTTDQGYIEYLKNLAYNGLSAIVSSKVTIEKFEFINSYMKGQRTDILFENFPIIDKQAVDQSLEVIANFYPYTQHYYYETDITGNMYGLTQSDMISRIKEFDRRITQTYQNTLQITIVIQYADYTVVDPLYIRKVFQNTKNIKDILFTIENTDQFDEFVKTWSDEIVDGYLGIRIDLSKFKDDNSMIDAIANRAQYLYNFSQIVIDSKNMYDSRKVDS